MKEKNWKIEINTTNKEYPFIIIDNWYNKEEEESIWKELDFYSSISKEKIDRAENTIVAKNIDGSPKSKSFRWYLNTYYTDEGIKKSTIINSMYKVRSEHFHKIVNKIQPLGRMLLSTNGDNTMVSYYEENDYYDSHHDIFQWTQCIWFVREPKLFLGGDFDFPESGSKIKLKHNRSIFFPSCFLHRVSPVKFIKPPKKIGFGRYTITHFYFTTPRCN